MPPLAIITLALALAAHMLSFTVSAASDGRGVFALRGAVAIELLAAASVAVFVLVRYRGKSERRVASVCIFTASLVLSLCAPALFLPPAAERGEWWALLGSDSLNVGGAMPAFLLWSGSLLAGGLAMHLLVARRWHMRGGPART